MKGILFDIQKFALHDGPGIGTVVFLKGCPLICSWCCNPESQLLQPQLAYDPLKCKDNLECVFVCEPGAHSSLFGNHRFNRGNVIVAGAAYQTVLIMLLSFMDMKQQVMRF